MTLGHGVPSKVLLSLLWFLNDLPLLGAVDSKVLVGFCSVVVVPGGFTSPMGLDGDHHCHKALYTFYNFPFGLQFLVEVTILGVYLHSIHPLTRMV